MTHRTISQRKTRFRRLFSERLETRTLFAADVLHNFLMPHDVDDDGSITPIDALVVINRLNKSGETAINGHEFEDVDDDSQLTPLDALAVINKLNSTTVHATTDQSTNVPGVSGVRARVELESEGAEAELKIRVDNAPASSSFDVTLNDIALGQLMTDTRGRGELLLSRGGDDSNRSPLPDALIALSPDMELVIGDIVRGKIARAANVEETASLHLLARFSPIDRVERSAEFERESEGGLVRQRFEAALEHAAANGMFDVAVDGILIGRINTDINGKGRLRLSNHSEHEGDQPFPESFPDLESGSIVTIGDVSSGFNSVI